MVGNGGEWEGMVRNYGELVRMVRNGREMVGMVGIGGECVGIVGGISRVILPGFLWTGPSCNFCCCMLQIIG